MTGFVRSAVLGAGVLVASALSVLASDDWARGDFDVLIIGEFHDNPMHHAHQADAVKAIEPTAVVFEMLTPQEAEQLARVTRAPDAMMAATSGFHWTNIDAYADILASSSVIIGAALPREDMRAAFSDGAVQTFGDAAATYGLTTPLGSAEQTVREDLQFDAHCAAMPRDMMGGMVEAQRLRDAHFARTVIEAIDAYGAPVILITGNGHARTDWGVPVYLSAARADLVVHSVGQGEGGVAPLGSFDRLFLDVIAPTRKDPCAAFETSK